MRAFGGTSSNSVVRHRVTLLAEPNRIGRILLLSLLLIGSELHASFDCDLFFSKVISPHLQAEAIDILLNSSFLPPNSPLRRHLEEKRAHFRHVSNDRALADLSAEVQYQRSLEIVLTSFDNKFGNDLALREAVINEMAKSPHSDERTVEILARLARGLNIASPNEAKLANEAIIAIATRRDLTAILPIVQHGLGDGAAPTDLLALAKVPIQSIKKLGEGNSGVNGTYLITFANGRKAIFKPAQGEEFYNRDTAEYLAQMSFPREADAARFFRAYFNGAKVIDTPSGKITFHVPEAAEVVLNATLSDSGKKAGTGSLQVFEDGFLTLNEAFGPYEGGKEKITDWQKYSEVWKRAEKDPQWKEILSWMQTFDYANGNHDRAPNSVFTAGNPNNLMVKRDPATGRITSVVLIDNAKGRNPGGGFNMGDARNVPNRDFIPTPMKDAVRAFNPERYRQANASLMPPKAIDDVIARMVELKRLIGDR